MSTLHLSSHVKRVDHEVKVLKIDFQEIREELDHKMDDNHRKLDTVLNKLDLSKWTSSTWYRKFYCFGLIHIRFICYWWCFLRWDKVCSRVLGKQENEAECHTMLGLVSDAFELSQIIGKAGYEIFMDSKKTTNYSLSL